MGERKAEIDALATALCREYHPLRWDIAHGNPGRPFGCYPCRMHAARMLDSLPDCEGWTCQSCGADNFIPAGFLRVIPPGQSTHASTDPEGGDR